MHYLRSIRSKYESFYSCILFLLHLSIFILFFLFFMQILHSDFTVRKLSSVDSLIYKLGMCQSFLTVPFCCGILTFFMILRSDLMTTRLIICVNLTLPYFCAESIFYTFMEGINKRTK